MAPTKRSRQPTRRLSTSSLKLQPLIGLPVSFYGQSVGEDEAGMLPSQNGYLLGLEGHPEWGPTTINWSY
jgi:hypothetical protein